MRTLPADIPRLLLANDVACFAPAEPAVIEHGGGRIVKVARAQRGEIEELAARADSLDLRGYLVLPGLIDAHVHAITTGMLMLTPDLHGENSLASIEAAVRAEEQHGRDVLRLGGLDPSRLRLAAGECLDMAWLDGVAPAKSLVIKSVEGHSAWFNALAWDLLGVDTVLARCGVDAARQGEMRESGRVHGSAYEELASSLYDTYSDEERREGLELVLTRAADVGLTCIHCLEGYGARRRSDFHLILDSRHGACDLILYARDETPQLAVELGVKRFGGCWCVDGAIGAHSAAISEPYADKPGWHGELYFSEDELRSWIEAGLRQDMQVCVHAIGDRALAQVIGVYEELAGSYELAPMRHRVDHFVLGTPELAGRAAGLGLVSAMQPAFDAFWGGPAGGYATRLGPARALRANPVGEMISCGLRVAGSSDSYITPLDPLSGIRAAMNHHNPSQRVSFDTAVRLFTEDAAYLAHEEDIRGRIATGYLADLTVVMGDRTLDGAKVAMTIKEGRAVYVACDASALLQTT